MTGTTRIIEHEGVFVASPELLRAIGRVTFESALADDLCREILTNLGPSEVYDWVFDGQSSQWLLDSCAVMVDNVDPWKRLWPEVVHDAFRWQLKCLDVLRPERNAIVHGTWRTDNNGPEAVRPRGSRSNPPASEILYCSKSRPKKYIDVLALTVEDVERLAQCFRTERRRLTDLARHMSFSGGNGHPYPRWP